MIPRKIRPIIASWLEALYSGLFTKGTDVLHNVACNTYCCLGVKCRQLVNEKILDAFVHENTTEFGKNGDFSKRFLPRFIAGEIGTTRSGRFSFNLIDGQIFTYELAELNDDPCANFTFVQIADIIKYLETWNLWS